ncbi:solute carrier family 31 (copper transporter), member 1 [Sporothrix brasiliensis 5110]|uniref:Copper transport protein n=1 Tax=Sporothrix brasiliensis 5110 TaxID=1398154 RepID=A0A0C2J9X6_9PEZI|nr:solute carrier family 31 (copper transporter), member 1 [Sporothrix brasiliensis 5110]KIH93712.1 solute carrier family 31 (copper transporter), member 1 [Sporothrix brasiliensis 5110]
MALRLWRGPDMLWNWNTVGACFIARSWRITSRGVFAGSCIGVVLLTMSLLMLRRAGREYDRYLVRQHRAANGADSSKVGDKPDPSHQASQASPLSPMVTNTECGPCAPAFRPSVLQQMIRSVLFVLQFGVGYFVMLLAMYYNGYFIICILIGAFLGSFVFNWEPIGE